MKRGPERRTREKARGARGDSVLVFSLVGLLMFNAVRVALSMAVTDKGAGYMAAAEEIFLAAAFSLSYGLSRSVSVLTKYRVKRGQYINAGRVLSVSILIAAVGGLLSGFLLFFLSGVVAETFILEALSYMAIAAVAAAVPLMAVTGVLQGYFQGMGTPLPLVHSRLLVSLLYAATGILSASAVYSYGKKVAALLQGEDYAFAYGAMGAMVGLSAACLLGFAHLLTIYLLFSGTRKRLLMKDAQKGLEARGKLAGLVLSTAVPYVFAGLLYQLHYLVDQRAFNYYMNIRGLEGIRAEHWGLYYGKYWGITGVSSIALCLLSAGAVTHICAAVNRNEYANARERLHYAVHTLSVWAMPWAVLLAVLAGPISGSLYSGGEKTVTRLLAMGTALVVLIPLTFLSAGILQRCRRIKLVLINGVLAFIAHLPVMLLLFRFTSLGIETVVISVTVFFAVAAALNFFMLCRILQYRQEWLRCFVLPFAAAGISGLIVFILVRALSPVLGSLGVLLAGLLLGTLAYTVLLIVLKGVTAAELGRMPGGRLVVKAASALRLM